MSDIKTQKWVELANHFNLIDIQAGYIVWGAKNAIDEAVNYQPLPVTRIDQCGLLNSLLQDWEVELSSNFLNCPEINWVSYCMLVNDQFQKWIKSWGGLQRTKFGTDYMPPISQVIIETLYNYYADLKMLNYRFSKYYNESKKSLNWNKIKEFKNVQTLMSNPEKNKLLWKGQKNQLYNVLRQLKNDHELIGNSYSSLADFLIQNVTGYENTSRGTIEKELQKNESLPKPKRIKIEPGEAE